MEHDYESRVRMVLQYIEENSHRKLSLDELARTASFSKYHFARVFAAVTGETPAAYVNRVRVRKAARLLSQTDRQVLDIAGDCGFESLSAFHAQFKKHYGMPPGEARTGALEQNRKEEEASRNIQEASPAGDLYNRVRSSPLAKRAWDCAVEICELTDREVACVRHVGSYLDTAPAWSKLGQWARRQGLTPERQRFIGVSLDDGYLVDEYACRYDACVSLPAGFAKGGHDGDVGFKLLPGGLYARYSYYGSSAQFVLAYETMFRLWLPGSGYEPDDRPCQEWLRNDPAMDPEGKCKVDLYVPIRKAVLS
ncbi:AraC family transcriptional regulator [Paenibacillus soyae]|uniref:AraC family transcriptional regulator n=1 Tax=Paenibacillus soyae TaxID=2969249 RepID=A0A9X2MVJ9_9BACL|nr:AraC family transcriptional regulator [Paenibacillus soyae]MCR2807104.1 AraC family transcriptional regulator [Paenibacillus soyae]